MVKEKSLKQKDKIKLVKAILEANLKSNMSDISMKLDDQSGQIREMRIQLDRLEHKIDLLLSSQDFTPNWSIILKKKIFES